MSETDSEFTEKFEQIDDELRRLQPLAGPGIVITDTGAGQRFETLPAPPPEPAGGESYSGPFKVIKKDSTSVTLLGYNSEEQHYARNYVTLGLSRLEVAETELSGISADAWIYLEISWSGSEYTISVLQTASLPAQSDTYYYIPIAFVKTESGAISGITQIQFGPIEGSGRIF